MSKEDSTCPECGSEKLVYTPEIGETACSTCGLIIDEHSDPLPTQDYLDKTSGVTLEHLADKNLTTDFNPYEIKDPDLAHEYARLRALNKTAPIRPRQSSICTVGLRIRPLLERTQLSPEIIKKAVSIAASKIAKVDMLRIRCAYEALAIYSLVRTDRRRLLLMGLSRIVEMITGSKKSKILDYNGMRFDESRKVWIGEIVVPNSASGKDCIVDCKAVSMNGGNPINIAVSMSLNNPAKGESPVYKAAKRKGNITLTLLAKRSDSKLHLQAKIKRSKRTPGAQEVNLTIKLSRGARYIEAMNAYNTLCTYFGEPIMPLYPEDFVQLDDDLDAESRLKVVDKARFIKEELLTGAFYQPMGWRIVTAAASWLVTLRSTKRIASKYGVDHGILRSKIRQISNYIDYNS